MLIKDSINAEARNGTMLEVDVNDIMKHVVITKYKYVLK